MKAKIATLLVAATLSFAGHADESKTITLANGATATVLAQSGIITTYVKSADVGADGKAVLVPGEVFDGTRLVKGTDGHCVKLVDRLVRMDDVVSSGGILQRPVIQHTEESVSCSS